MASKSWLTKAASGSVFRCNARCWADCTRLRPGEFFPDANASSSSLTQMQEVSRQQQQRSAGRCTLCYGLCTQVRVCRMEIAIKGGNSGLECRELAQASKQA
mmetsp:Transcript_24839/g.67667  ORF Transcript_24839/g.67667 Transcript_24839/m.67667 type:complete len:102 (+) Transcript_24839:2912-3217(+)